MFVFRMLTSIWSLSLLTTCVHEQKGPLANLEQSEKLDEFFRSPSQQLADLEKVLEQGDTKHLAPLVNDVKLMLTAMSYEQKSALADAGEYWQQSMNIAKGEFAKKAFEGWFQNYLKQIESPKDLGLLASLVLKETQQGRNSQYLADAGFTSKESLIPYLKTLMKRPTQKIQSKQGQDTLFPPSRPGIPEDDPLLEELSEKYCKMGMPDSYQWKAWFTTLSPATLKYWQGLAEKCDDEEHLAIRTFTEAGGIAERSSRREDHVIAVASYEHLVKLLRANDGRPEAARYYKALMSAWELPGLSPKSMGLENHEFTLRHINDSLWAARYRALIGDYQNAKVFVQNALELISNAHNLVDVLTASISEELAGYKAEAYHILSFRIAVEQNEYAHAAALTKAALQTPHISKEWTHTLKWYLGLYEYLDGRISKAVAAWQELLDETADDEIKAKVLFWLSYLHHQKGANTQRDQYLAVLAKEYPLSFYHVVAPKEAGMTDSQSWQKLFPEPKKLESNLKKTNSYKTSILRGTEPLSSYLAKSELLLFAGLKAWAMLPSENIYSSAIQLAKTDPDEEAFIYLSRMLYAVENFERAMNLTYELIIRNEEFWQDWPEQVHIYFPRAYAKHYKRQATNESVDLALLYGITRQESMFDSKAISSAKAMGLMQIIKPTARRLTSLSGLKWDSTKDRLFEPKINIRLGSTYIKLLGLKYKKFLPAVIAAYNAGEYAVDMWIRRRVHPMKLLWAEMIPFGETRKYVQRVWRNYAVYRYLGSKRSMVTIFPNMMHKRRARAEYKKKTMKH
ncbi:MAG: lytic transglycosylase domain-containing protein [Oligoflexales bacterium]